MKVLKKVPPSGTVNEEKGTHFHGSLVIEDILQLKIFS